MTPVLSPNGQTTFELDSPPLLLLVGTSKGIVTLARESVSSPWQEIGRSLGDRHIGALVNASGSRIFAGCHHGGGIFRSTGGAEYESVGSKIVGTNVFSLAVTQTPDGEAIFAGVEPVNLFRTDDYGDTWSELPAIATLPGAEHWSFPPPPHLPHLKAMTIDPTDPQTLFACVEQGALLRSEDLGESWVELDGMWTSDDPAYRDAHRLVVAPWNPQLLIFASGIGVYKSNDGGINWVRNGAVHHFTSYPDALIASRSDRSLFVGGPKDVPGGWLHGSPLGTVCRSEDDGETWVPMCAALDIGPRANVEGLSIVNYPGGYTLFLGDTDGCIFSSDDRGETWNKIAKLQAVSKGAHHKIAQMSEKLPRWVRPGVGIVFEHLMKNSARKAAAKRLADFSSRYAK